MINKKGDKMVMWNPWRGCYKYSEGCQFCYIHKGDKRKKIDTNQIVKTNKFYAPIAKNKNGEYKIKSGKIVYLCFSSDFLLEEADSWREECWQMIKERSDLQFIFLTKRINRFMQCVPADWGEGYKNVTVGCTVENQKKADERLSLFVNLPIRHKNIICQPLLEAVNIDKYLAGIELVVVGGESDYQARPLNYEWVLEIRKQCIMKGVPFQFRQCGTNFIKDGKKIFLKTNQLCYLAKELNINYYGGENV